MHYDAQFLTFSSDLVFDGITQIPYVESSPTAPLNTYGAAKAYAETHVLESNPSALVVRTSAFFGPWDEHNFLAKMIHSLEQEQHFLAANDQIISPTYVPDLVNNCLDLIIDKANGIWHLANSAALTWAEFALKAARAGELNMQLIKSVSKAELGLKAQRPVYSALGTEKGNLMPTLDDAIGRYFSE